MASDKEQPRATLRGVLVRQPRLIEVPERKTRMVRATVRAGDEWLVLAYGEYAEALAALRSGTVVVLQAELQNHRWHTADGTTHQSVSFVVTEVQECPTPAN